MINPLSRVHIAGNGDQFGTYDRAQRLVTSVLNRLQTSGDPAAEAARMWKLSVDAAVDKAKSQGYKCDIDQMKCDSAGTTGVGALRHTFNTVLTDPVIPSVGMQLLSVNSEMSPWQRTWEMKRFELRAQAEVWRPGGNMGKLPGGSWEQDSVEGKTQYYITAVGWNFFEQQWAVASGTNNLQRLIAASRDVLNEFAGFKTLFGDDEIGLLGLLNQPYVTRSVLSGPSNKAWSINEDVSSVDTELFVEALVKFVSKSYLDSRGAYRPNRLLMPGNMLLFLKGRRIKRTSDSSDKTLLQAFLESNIAITSESQITVVEEFRDAFGDGVSAVVALDDSANTVENIVPMGGIQSLPMMESGFEMFQPLWMSHGGVLVKRPQNISIAYVQTEV